MKRLYLLCLFAVIVDLLSFSQTVLLDDSFKDNSNIWNEWDRQVSKMDVVEKRDQYVLKHNRKKGILVSHINVDLNQKRDFKIEALIYKQGGTKHSGYGILWGGKDDYNFYSFLVTGDGVYMFGKVDNNVWKSSTGDWKDNSAIQHGRKAFNKFTVLKKGSQYTLSINDTPVAKVPFEPFFGNRVGFNVNRKQKVLVEYIRVEYLN